MQRWPPELIAGVVGAWLLLSSALWGVRARRRRRREVRRMLADALRSPDPSLRRAAVLVAVQHGLENVARDLVDATVTERDPVVLEGIAEAVTRNQWEPTENRYMLVLRLWAQRRVEEKAAARTERDAARADEHV